MDSSPPPFIEPPGVFIDEELEARGWTRSSLASALGMPLRKLNPFLSGALAISPAMARSLGDVFNVAPGLFANLSNMYQLSKALAADRGRTKTRP